MFYLGANISQQSIKFFTQKKHEIHTSLHFYIFYLGANISQQIITHSLKNETKHNKIK